MRLNDYYNDRGIQKYNGFYLSEHSSEINNTNQERNKIISGKEQLTEEEIYDLINYSIYKSRKVAIQMNIKDINGNFLEEIRGFINGCKDDIIFLNSTEIPLSQIRHIRIIKNTNWKDIKKGDLS
ncbi:hypothetical protein [Enterococcus mundtii]|uniref:hypothetical protein n=1 Tax=Enterococcus mundtii TaxID=53346 RepID=UPI001A961054|nr:hypothetical protein [Enterococcus mundtii]MBO1087125.1 hypothetical protein [Enterococcus mundtii]